MNDVKATLIRTINAKLTLVGDAAGLLGFSKSGLSLNHDFDPNSTAGRFRTTWTVSGQKT